MGNSFRIDRVGMEIKREVNEILQQKVRDSNLASDSQKAQTGLEKATGTIKRELGKNLTMYKIPDLTFIKDESIEYGNKIDEMLRNLERKD